MEGIGTLLASDVYRGVILTLGVVVAVVSVITAKIIARRKQTIDALMAGRNDKGLLDGLACVAKLHNKDDANMRSFAKPERRNEQETEQLLFVLNHWEYVAIGIRKGIYDDNMYRLATHGTATGLYSKARPFIEALRQNHARPMIFAEFEHLAERWLKQPLQAPPKGLARLMWWR